MILPRHILDGSIPLSKLNNNYSAGKQVIGKTSDNKTVYREIVYGTLPSQVDVWSDVLINQNITEVLFMSGIVKTTADNASYTFPTPDISLYFDGVNKKFRTRARNTYYVGANARFTFIYVETS